LNRFCTVIQQSMASPTSSMTCVRVFQLVVSRELPGYTSAEDYPRLPHWISATKS
jgi:hypothetical protein